MKRLSILFAVIFGCFFLAFSVKADEEIHYRIESYKGILDLKEDSSAVFTQEIDFRYSSDFNGQYVTLGAMDPLPKGFKIQEDPKIEVYKNDQLKEHPFIETNSGSNGHMLKIYNSGESGDHVKIRIQWQLKRLLFLYQDIAVLNWVPLSDGDKTIHHLEFTIQGLKADQGELFAHTGFFRDQPQVERIDQGYRVTLKDFPAKANIEFHAYWPMTEAMKTANAADVLQRTHLAIFQKQEAEIARKSQQYHFIFGQLLPIASAVLLIFAFCYFISYVRSTRNPDFPKNLRFYEVPQDLPPLVLAKNLYRLEFDKMAFKQQTGSVRFDNMVRATILDLIDRGNLVYRSTNQERLELVQVEGLSDFERRFVDMLFGQRSSATANQFFDKYKINREKLEEAYESATSREDREKVKAQGERVRDLFTQDARTLAAKVGEQEELLGLPSHYRSLTREEKKWAILGSLFYSFATILVLAATLFMGMAWGTSALVNRYLLSLIFLLVVGVAWWFWARHRKNQLLSAAHLDTYVQWISFENMLKTIDQFHQAELESIVIWNRILVYATLFGQAWKVSKTLKAYDIHLDNPALESFVFSHTAYSFISSVNVLQTYVSDSRTVSDFSLHDSSGSGGFDGGGFSGGGGGGGVGSF